MIYNLIISLLIEKPFYLLRPQSFSFQIVSEFIDIFVKFSNFMSRGWGFWLACSVPRGGLLYTMIVPGGGLLLPSNRVPGVSPGGMVLDETDTCIMQNKTNLYLSEQSEQEDFHKLRTLDSTMNILELTHPDMVSPLWSRGGLETSLKWNYYTLLQNKRERWFRVPPPTVHLRTDNVT